MNMFYLKPFVAVAVEFILMCIVKKRQPKNAAPHQPSVSATRPNANEIMFIRKQRVNEIKAINSFFVGTHEKKKAANQVTTPQYHNNERIVLAFRLFIRENDKPINEIYFILIVNVFL